MGILEDFRGFAGEPRSEMTVVFLFGVLHDHLPFPFVTTRINDTFPDCEGIDPTNGNDVYIEFELLSRHYVDHGHPREGCDYIVCWKDNWPESPIPVISLKDLIKTKGLQDKCFIHVLPPDSLEAELEALKDKNPKAYAAVKHFKDVSLERVRVRVSDFYVAEDRTRHWGVKFGGKGGFVGFYPNRKLVCGSVDEIVRRLANR